MKMGFKEVLSNLTNFDCWDFKHYSLRQEEAEMCIIALEKCLDDKQTASRCPHCGKAIRNTFEFCPYCGRRTIDLYHLAMGGIASAEASKQRN